MTGWTTYKGIEVPDGATLNAGEKLTFNLKSVADAVLDRSLKITAAGTWLYSYPFEIVSQFVTASGPCNDAQETYLPNNAVGIQSFAYNEYAGSAVVPRLTELSFDNLVFCGSNFSPMNLPELVTLSVPELTTVGLNFSPGNMPALSTLSMPVLKDVGGNFSPGSMAGLTTLSTPQLTTVGGSVSPNNMAALTTLSMPVLSTVVTSFMPGNMASLGTLNLPELAIVVGSFSPSSMAALTSISLPALTDVGLSFNPLGLSALTSLDLPALARVGSAFNPGGMALTTLSVPALTTVGNVFNPAVIPTLTSLNAPALVSVGGATTVNNGFGNITSITFGTVGTTKVLNGNVNFSGQKLNQASVDRILAVVASLDGTNGTTSWGTGKTLTLNGGTNSTPSAAGLASKAIIVARGGTVLHN